MNNDPNLMPPTFKDVEAARQRIAPYVHQTQVLSSTLINQQAGAELFFKCENFQKTGSFKARGASNAVFSLTEDQASKGVATHSSGNHASALAYAAQQRGIAATVVMPNTALKSKKDAVLSYGASIIECEPSMSAREAAIAKVLVETGAEFVHPFNDARVIAGQATCSYELLQQIDGLDAVVAPIGGGGMISGICLSIKELAPQIAIYAAEPLNANDAARSLKAGKIIADDAPNTIADGLKVPIKELTWHFIKQHVSDILTATEEEIINAMRLIWQHLKIVMEPSSALPLAVILKNSELFSGKRIGVVITGGNVDIDKLPW